MPREVQEHTMSTATSTSPPGPTIPPARRPHSSAIRLGLIFTGSLVGLSILVGCGSSGSGSAPASAIAASQAAGGSTLAGSPATVAMIHIDNYRYAVPASVSPGEKVSVMNMDGETHTVTADSGGAFDDLATANTITTFVAPSKPGSYPFHCAFHANMHGVLVVK
jgi:plastocyanin